MEDIFTPEIEFEKSKGLRDKKLELTNTNNYCRDGLLDIKISTSSTFPLSAYTRIRSSFKPKKESLLNSQKHIKTEIGFKKSTKDENYSFLGNFSNEGDFNFLAANFHERSHDDTTFYAKINKGIYGKIPKVDLGFLASYNEMLISVCYLFMKDKFEFRR